MSILCAVELAHTSIDTLSVAMPLAHAMGSRRVIAAHVLPDKASDQAVADALATLNQRIAAQAIDPHPAAIHIEARVVRGAPGAQLATLAHAENARLTIAGANHAGRIGLGGVANEIIGQGPVPVLALRSAVPWKDALAGVRPLKIMLGLDDATVSEVALNWLIMLSHAMPIELVVGSVYYPDEASERYGIKIANLVDANAELEALLTRDLDQRVGPTTSLAKRTLIAQRGLGRIGDHLLDVAQALQADVVMVGTSQQAGLGRLGSVSAAVVAGATQSALCVPVSTRVAPRPPTPITRVLATTDLTPGSNRAIAAAAALATGGLRDLHLAHVVPATVELAPYEQALRQACPPLPDGVALHTHVLVSTDAAHALAVLAAKLGVQTIVMASQQRGKVAKAILGSVADAVMAKCHRPVMVLRIHD